MRNLKFGLLAAIFSFNVVAGASYHVPVPLEDNQAARLLIGVNGHTNFLDVMRGINGSFAATFAWGGGFEGGLGIAGGAVSNDPTESFYTSGATLGVPVNLSGMVRYFADITQLFHLGFQFELGYGHDFQVSRIAQLGWFNINAGIPFDFKFGDAASLYLMPEFNVGVSRNATTKMPSSTFGSDLRVGTLIALGTPTASLMLEAKPGVGSVSKSLTNNFYTNFMVGVAINL